MKFVYPAFLIALIALLIPIIIHLFNFRRFKTVYFTNVRFLKEVKQETAARSKLKHWLVLLSRLLALTLLVFAFAQPYISVADQASTQSQKAISIYVDNSFSMNAGSEDQPLLEKAKSLARDIARAYSEEDVFQITTNDFAGKHLRFINREEFIGFVDEIELSPAVRNIEDVIKRQKSAFESEGNKQHIVYLISDFQKNITVFENDSSLTVNVIPLQAVERKNIYIDSCWFESPVQLLNQPCNLIVRLVNTGTETVNTSRLTLKLNGEIKALSDFSLDPTSFVYDTVSFTVTQPGWNRADLTIIDYPVTFDDNYFFAFEVAERINVVTLHENKENPYLGALFQSEDIFRYTASSVNRMNYARLKDNQMIVLDGLGKIPSGLSTELVKYLEQGGVVTVFPALQIDKESYNGFLGRINANLIVGLNERERSITTINVDEGIFRDVFEELPENINLPRTNRSYEVTSRVNTNEESVLRFKDRGSALSKYRYASGEVYLSSIPLDISHTDLPVHALFVPMLYKMAVMANSTSNIAYFIGKDVNIRIPNVSGNSEQVYKIKGNKQEIIPRQKAIGPTMYLGLTDQLKTSGIYEIYQDNDDIISVVALNYDRAESDLTYVEKEELEKIFKGDNVNVISSVQGSIQELVGELDRGIVLWKLCIILALFFLAVEIFLLRFLRS